MLKLSLLCWALASTPVAFASEPAKDTKETMESVVREYYEAYNGRSIDGQLVLMSDDIVYVSSSGKVRSGKDTYRKYTEDLFKEVNEKCSDLRMIVDLAQSIVVAQTNANGTAGKAKYTLPVIEVFEFAKGKIKKLTTYYNEEIYKKQVEKK